MNTKRQDQAAQLRKLAEEEKVTTPLEPVVKDQTASAVMEAPKPAVVPDTPLKDNKKTSKSDSKSGISPQSKKRNKSSWKIVIITDEKHKFL